MEGLLVASSAKHCWRGWPAGKREPRTRRLHEAGLCEQRAQCAALHAGLAVADLVLVADAQLAAACVDAPEAGRLTAEPARCCQQLSSFLLCLLVLVHVAFPESVGTRPDVRWPQPRPGAADLVAGDGQEQPGHPTVAP